MVDETQLSQRMPSDMVDDLEDFAEDHGLDVLAEIGSHEVAGVDPTIMGIGPVPAVRGLGERTGRDPADYDLVVLNEAFASQ